ncbi:hypothetical protein AK88_05556, partial [Plasmodium fragile]
MGLFITHMHADSEYDNAINCENAYWEHPAEHATSGQSPRKMDRSTERVICRLMTQAIYFANAWSQDIRNNAEDNEGKDTEIKGIMRCTIADIYQDILRTYGCEGWWGTYYAWYTTQIMGTVLENQLGENHCKRGMYKEIELGHWPMRNKMKTWLEQDASMQKKLAQEQIGDDCKGAKVKLEVGPREEEQEKTEDNKTKDAVQQHVRQILGNLKHAMKQEEDRLKASRAPAPTYPSGAEAHDQKAAAIEAQMNKAIEHVKDKIKEVIAKNASAQAAAAAKAAAATPASTGVGTTPAAAEKEPKKEDAAPAKVPEAPKALRPAQTGPATVNGAEGVARSDESAPGSIPQPPPAAPATAQDTVGTGTGTGSSGAPNSQKAHAGNTSTADCGATTTSHVSTHGEVTVRTEISFAPSSSSECSGKDGANGPGSSGSPSAPAEAAPTAADPAKAAPEATPKGTSGDSGTPSPAGPGSPTTSQGTLGEKDARGGAGETGETGAAGEAGNTVPSVAEGGKDDPPLLNPPKPKPNPNPNQSGSSGSFSDADLADGVSGGEGKGGGDSGGVNGGVSAGGSGAGAGVGGAGGSPPSSGPSPDTKDQPLPILPPTSKPFDPRGLIPYTPAIIPAVVGIGVIAFFLWKYEIKHIYNYFL